MFSLTSTTECTSDYIYQNKVVNVTSLLLFIAVDRITILSGPNFNMTFFMYLYKGKNCKTGIKNDRLFNFSFSYFLKKYIHVSHGILYLQFQNVTSSFPHVHMCLSVNGSKSYLSVKTQILKTENY